MILACACLFTFWPDDTDFGLAASVWSNDLDRAQAIAAQIQAGTGNDHKHSQLFSSSQFISFSLDQ